MQGCGMEISFIVPIRVILSPARCSFTFVYKAPTSSGKKWRLAPSRLLVRLQPALEVESQFRGQRSRRHVMRSAERGKKVVERVLLRQVDDGQLRTPLVLVAVKEIVMPQGKIKKTPRGDALRVVVKGPTGCGKSRFVEHMA